MSLHLPHRHHHRHHYHHFHHRNYQDNLYEYLVLVDDKHRVGLYVEDHMDLIVDVLIQPKKRKYEKLILFLFF
jgi:hypothetical protein